MTTPHQIWLVRHADTEWSASGRHTSRTDLPLLPEGEAAARALAPILAGHEFSLVLSSPRLRARRTAELSGYGARIEIAEDLCEWDYGQDEGLTTAQIRQSRPDWDIWQAGPLGGETVEQVGLRCQRVIQRAITASGDTLCFAHGHVLRIFAATWLQLPPSRGRSFTLRAGTISVLGFERQSRAIICWDTGGLHLLP